MSLSVTVVVISKDEAPRLRLALESLSCQSPDSEPFEVVVVNDGSQDETHDLLDQAEKAGRLRALHHLRSVGRSAARNAGARMARGDVLLFMDGDILAAPELIAAHARAHAQGERVLGRGATYHLRCTRFFHDPQRGTPMPGQEERVAKMGRERATSLVTLEQIRHAFDEIDRRAEPGIYPGAAPRQLFELEMAGLRVRPRLSVGWMAASGHNFSIPRQAFLASGGYEEELTINEHRELALRLCDDGFQMVPVEARSYHLTHRVGWRDPLGGKEDSADGWEQRFYALHPTLATKLMSIFWLSIGDDPHLPIDARIRDLEQFDRIVRQGTPIDYDEIRRHHPRLTSLPSSEARWSSS
jgi:glycosyltransferase involved in cell wall biosynthesis